MKNTRNNFAVMLIIALCGTFVYAQKSQSYPTNVDDVIASVELFSQKDFSIKDAVKLLGTFDEDSYDAEDWAIELTPFASEIERVESVRIDTYDKQKKLDAVQIEYIEPVLISYGKLKQKYGKPNLSRPPIVNCQSDENCRPAFVGYDFKFIPDRKKPDFGKRIEVFISLEMEWSKTIPKHTDKDLLKVKSIRFKRNIPDELPAN